MKEILTRNIGYKIASLALAAVLWLIIINVDDPVKTAMVTNVPVNVLHAEDLDALNKVYDIVEGNTVSVTIKGKRSIVYQITASDLVVTADITNQNAFNKVDIDVSCPKFDYAELEFSTNPGMLTVVMDEKAEQNFKVTVEQSGTPSEGYYVMEASAKPNMVNVTGAESVVNEIAEIRAKVEVSGASQDFTSEQLALSAYNSKGELIESNRLKYNVENVRVDVHIVKTKSVPVQFTITKEPKNGYQITQMEKAPAEIELAGESKTLKKISKVEIPIDASEMTKTDELEFDLNEYIPEGVVVVSQNSTAVVKFTIEASGNKTFDISANKIKRINIPDGMKVSIDSDSQVQIIVSGLSKDLEKLTSVSNLDLYIDLEQAKEGDNLIEIKSGIDTDKYKISFSVSKVLVKLTKNSLTEDDSSEPVEETPSSSQPSTPAQSPATPGEAVDNSKEQNETEQPE